MGIALLAALAASVKVSLLVYPVTIGLWWLAAWRTLFYSPVAAALSLLAALAAAALLILVRYGGDPGQIQRFAAEFRSGRSDRPQSVRDRPEPPLRR